MYVGPRSVKFNIVSNDHGKTNFTGHHTPDTIKDFKGFSSGP